MVYSITTVILIFVTAMTAFIGPMIWYGPRRVELVSGT